jgi:hypothetical protein
MSRAKPLRQRRSVGLGGAGHHRPLAGPSLCISLRPIPSSMVTSRAALAHAILAPWTRLRTASDRRSADAAQYFSRRVLCAGRSTLLCWRSSSESRRFRGRPIMTGRPSGRYRSQDASVFRSVPMHDQDASVFRSVPVHNQDASGFYSVPVHDQDASSFRIIPEEDRAG